MAGVKTFYIKKGKYGRIHKLMVDDASGYNFVNEACNTDQIKAAVADYGILPAKSDIMMGYIRGWMHDGQRICRRCFKTELAAAEHFD